MSQAANWSYTATATFWKQLGMAENGDPLGFAPPVVVMCDYGLERAYRQITVGDLGVSAQAKNTFWTEFSEAKKGDYIMVGVSDNPNPVDAGADEVMRVIRYADTFDRLADDYAIMTSGN